MARFTTEQKYRAAKREWVLRKALYPHRVKNKTMHQDECDFEILVMRRIMRDYKLQLEEGD
jgi:hypothetical protein